MQLTWCAEPPDAGRTLFLLFAYHGRDRDAEPSWFDRFEGAGARGHRIVHRDHYANPRTLAYQVAMIAAARERLTPDEPADLAIDRTLGGDTAAQLAGGFGRVDVADLVHPRLWRDGIATQARSYRNVVLVYPDALGLGCGDAERRILRDRDRVLVINGRRRVFAVTRSYSYQMDIHRWLAASRAIERVFAAAVRPIASGLAAWDRLQSRT